VFRTVLPVVLVCALLYVGGGLPAVAVPTQELQIPATELLAVERYPGTGVQAVVRVAHGHAAVEL